MRRWQIVKCLGLICVIFVLFQFFLWFHFPSKGDRDLPTYDVKQMVKKVLTVWKDLEDTLFVIEPEILYKILEQENYSDNEGRCAVFCHITRKAVTFGVFGHRVAIPMVLSKFRRSGFAAVDAKEDNPDSHLKNPGSSPHQIITHIFLQDMEQPELTIHVVVFYPRSGFLWTSQIQMPTSDLSFGATAGAFDIFETRSITIDGLLISVPKSIRHFLHMKQNSHFLECNNDRAKMFYTQYPKDETEEAQRFQRKARQLLVKGKEVLDNLGVRFWLSSGTCLGWFRQCDIISYSKDVDFGIWIKDHKPEIIDAMERAGLPLKHVFGKVSDSYELSFKAGEVKLDIFFFYEEGDTMWNGGTDASSGEKLKYVFPKFDLCWTLLLDIRVRVPCPTQPYIEANYGKQWDIPVKSWDWKSNAFNVRPNGVWPKSEWKEVIQVY
ncbi:ribitol-5-phosphate transferase FKTN-like [Saccostrea echinata]|uniref:ribitol-5-phosphate transferase FKTN-like n=1 Tax=Saccostrea echinata TaxID=191078 RepID=UPI002A83106B|nr:ribitol-5-phosphate transferase FKTN-like [Saccostrea echinata]